jgi:hypothetical protein
MKAASLEPSPVGGRRKSGGATDWVKGRRQLCCTARPRSPAAFAMVVLGFGFPWRLLHVTLLPTLTVWVVHG